MAPNKTNILNGETSRGRGLNSSTDLEPTSKAPKLSKQEYQEYLQSESWKQLRQQVMEYYNYQCYDCGSNATEIHHTNYANILTDKEFYDCIPQCYDCHREKHQ